MHTQITSKISAFAFALLLNSLMMAGVSYVFNQQSHGCAQAAASVDAVAQLPDLVRA